MATRPETTYQFVGPEVAALIVVSAALERQMKSVQTCSSPFSSM